MKFLSKINLTKFSPSHIWSGAIAFIGFLTLLVILFSTIFGGQSRIEEALLSGQRLEINLQTKEIYGKVLKTPEFLKAEAEVEKKKGKKKTANKKTDETVDKPTEEQASEEEEKQSDKPEVSKEFAWINEDFIGPRMEQTVLDLLTGGSKEELEMETVSLSELSENPVIIVIVKGLGLSASTTENALELPKNVTLGFSPYSPSIEDWVSKAKERNHEIVLNVPMETKDYRLNDPGPYALITKADKEDNITRLKMLLSLIDGYEAIYSEKEEIFTHAINSAKPILEELKQQRKYFIYGGGYADFSLIQVADNMGYPIMVNDILLDDEITMQGINEKFKQIEEYAREKGYVIVMAHPYPITIRMLERWIPEAEARGFNIAPISLLLGKKIVN